MGRICYVQELFWISEKNSVHNMFSPGLSLEFSCIELLIQWTICRNIVGWLMQKIIASDKDLSVIVAGMYASDKDLPVSPLP